MIEKGFTFHNEESKKHEQNEYSEFNEKIEENLSKEANPNIGMVDLKAGGLIPPVIEESGEIRVKGNLDDPDIQQSIINEENLEKLKNIAEQGLHAIWKPKLGKNCHIHSNCISNCRRNRIWDTRRARH